MPIPLSARLTALFAVFVGTCLVLFISLANLPVIKKVEGLVVSDLGVARLVAPIAGELQMIDIKSDEFVESGKPLLAIRRAGSGDATTGLRAARLTLLRSQLDAITRSNEIEQKRLQSKVMHDRDVRLPRILEAVENVSHRMELVQKRLSQLQIEVARIEGFVKSGLVVSERLQSEKFRLEEISFEYNDLERARRSLLSDYDNLEHEIDDTKQSIELLKSTLVTDTSNIRLAISELDTDDVVTMMAPVSGTVGARSVELGKSVQPGDELATLVPEAANLIIEFHVASDVIGLVKEGMDVRLRYDSFPYQRYGVYDGIVTAVTYTSVNFQDAVLGNVSRFRVTATPDKTIITDGQTSHNLKPDMVVHGTIILYQRTMLQAMFETLKLTVGKVAG